MLQIVVTNYLLCICTIQRSDSVLKTILKQVLSSLFSVSLSIINPLKKTLKTNRNFSGSPSLFVCFVFR